MSEANNLPDLSDDRLWQVADVARFLGCSKSWVYRESGAGRLPSLNIGGLLRFDPNEIRAWVAKHRTAPAKVLAFGAGHK